MADSLPNLQQRLKEASLLTRKRQDIINAQDMKHNVQEKCKDVEAEMGMDENRNTLFQAANSGIQMNTFLDTKFQSVDVCEKVKQKLENTSKYNGLSFNCNDGHWDEGIVRISVDWK